MPQRGKLCCLCLSAAAARLRDASLLRAGRCLPGRLLEVVPQRWNLLLRLHCPAPAADDRPTALRCAGCRNCLLMEVVPQNRQLRCLYLPAAAARLCDASLLCTSRGFPRRLLEAVP